MISSPRVNNGLMHKQWREDSVYRRDGQKGEASLHHLLTCSQNLPKDSTDKNDHPRGLD